jgi:aspartate carbamoyltransferase catalytic subunit
MKADTFILHPLPRTVELDKSVDADPRAMYFRQAMNGLYVRMALLTMLLDKEQ